MAETFCYETFGRFEKGSAEFYVDDSGNYIFRYKWNLWCAYENPDTQYFSCFGPDGKIYKVRIAPVCSAGEVYIGSIIVYVNSDEVYRGYVLNGRWIEPVVDYRYISSVTKREVPDISIPEGKAYLSVVVRFRTATAPPQPPPPPQLPECSCSDYRRDEEVIYTPGTSKCLDKLSKDIGKFVSLTVKRYKCYDVKVYVNNTENYNTRPDGRRADDCNAQINDWYNGYVWERVQFNKCGERLSGGKYLAWIKYAAELNYPEQPPKPPEIPECSLSDFKGSSTTTYYPDMKPKSAALAWYYDKTGNYCTITVDWREPLEISKIVRYSNTEYNTRPDGKRADDYNAQINDFTNGYLWSRFRFNECGKSDPNGKYLAWIKYKAELYCEQPPAPPGEEEKYLKYAAAAFAAAAALSILFRRR